MAQQSTVITCNLNSPNPLFRPTQSDSSRLREVHFCRKRSAPHALQPECSSSGNLLNADEWLPSSLDCIFHERNTQQRLNPWTERGIWVWTIPKQKLPTWQQGLLKYSPETGQLKMAVRQSPDSWKSQASKPWYEQSEKKKLSLAIGILELCQAILQHDFQSCERDFLLLHNHPGTMQSTCTNLLSFPTQDRQKRSEDVKNYMITCSCKYYLSSDHWFILAKTEALKGL